MELIQISLSGTAGLGAGYFLKQILRRVRPAGEEPPTLQALHGAVAALQAIVARLEVIVSSIPTVQGDVAVLQQGQRQHDLDIRRIDHEITDIRREASQLDDRMRKLEKRN